MIHHSIVLLFGFLFWKGFAFLPPQLEVTTSSFRSDNNAQQQQLCTIAPYLCQFTSVTTSTSTTTCLNLNLGELFRDGNHKYDRRYSSSNKNARDNLSGIAGVMETMGNFESAQKVGRITNALLQELQSTTVEGSAHDGKIKVTFDCQQRPLKTFIDDSYYVEVGNNASEMAQSLSIAMRDGHQKSIEKMNEKIKNLYSELGLKY
mmetsp:Transcript_1782/g.2526  ORF Transcript_1782/g.2526 Transcript_1782/m.2526 type:complete len:205 (+) Transcript_1782:77-691(+)|eukprot:CAMPEP_0198149686 /NCGR_PEP_ID=MMETSP1443-20131203/47783_1 /TAXON_ID=186043 /ORGANISM="Entomoneis sp., Strain CCMP2396" /LENGTH=204 /DNA_ID=CAMNT_0043814795 /DNA_START=174 /DNA_END=788 /DNA_ORIENTATION=-